MVTLELVDAVKRYGSRAALAGVSLRLAAGEALGLLGPNGAGKTTALRLLLGFARASAGGVSLFGRDPRDLGGAPRRRLSARAPGAARPRDACAASCACTPALAGIAAAARDAEVDARRSRRVGLADRARDRIGGLSKGLRQRLGFANALLGKPALLVLDEPTSGLDPLGIRDARGWIQAARERGAALLVSSHGLSEVERTCDQHRDPERGQARRERRARRAGAARRVARRRLRARGARMNAFLLLAREALADALRRRIAFAVAVAALFSVAMLDSCTSCTSPIMVEGEVRELSDLAGPAGIGTFVALGLWVIVLAGVLASDHLRSTLEDGSALLSLARPLSRDSFALARLAGVLGLSFAAGLVVLGSAAALLAMRSELPWLPALMAERRLRARLRDRRGLRDGGVARAAAGGDAAARARRRVADRARERARGVHAARGLARHVRPDGAAARVGDGARARALDRGGGVHGGAGAGGCAARGLGDRGGAGFDVRVSEGGGARVRVRGATSG